MTKSNEREKLIEELSKYMLDTGRYGVERHIISMDLCDFILEDRKRICGPLVELNLIPTTTIKVTIQNMSRILRAIIQVLKLAGLLEDGE